MNTDYPYYRFEPLKDITAYELAVILGVFGAEPLRGSLRYVRYYKTAMESDDCCFRRHFKEVPEEEARQPG